MKTTSRARSSTGIGQVDGDHRARGARRDQAQDGPVQQRDGQRGGRQDPDQGVEHERRRQPAGPPTGQRDQPGEHEHVHRQPGHVRDRRVRQRVLVAHVGQEEHEPQGAGRQTGGQPGPDRAVDGGGERAVGGHGRSRDVPGALQPAVEQRVEAGGRARMPGIVETRKTTPRAPAGRSAAARQRRRGPRWPAPRGRVPVPHPTVTRRSRREAEASSAAAPRTPAADERQRPSGRPGAGQRRAGAAAGPSSRRRPPAGPPARRCPRRHRAPPGPAGSPPRRGTPRAPASCRCSTAAPAGPASAAGWPGRWRCPRRGSWGSRPPSGRRSSCIAPRPCHGNRARIVRSGSRWPRSCRRRPRAARARTPRRCARPRGRARGPAPSAAPRGRRAGRSAGPGWARAPRRWSRRACPRGGWSPHDGRRGSSRAPARTGSSRS